MLKITVISVGALKESYFAQAVAEYEKRISAYAKVTNINLKDENPGAARDCDISLVLAHEGEQILRSIPQKAYKIALCVEGKQVTSEEFAVIIDSAKDLHGEVCFIIGSSHGLAEEVKRACDLKLSFSKFTFPHRLMRVILAEAVYRALSISNGGKYHK